MGIFSKFPDILEESWFLINKEDPWFKQTGLKKTSVIKTGKIAVIHNSIVRKKLGNLPEDIFGLVKEKMRKTLKI